MMIVITLSCCPPKLRGDLTRWLVEIDTGIYVGNLSARVRDAVWERIRMNIGSGRATMVYSANNEQKLEFRIHNASWEPVDYDGMKLVRRNYTSREDDTYRKQSKAAVRHLIHQKQRNDSGSVKVFSSSYAVIDIETTGLQETDSIIELGAVIISEGEQQQLFSTLRHCETPVPDAVTELTGITSAMLAAEGKPLKEALTQFLSLVGSREIVGFSIGFDMKFLQRACREFGFPEITNKQTDVQRMARKKLKRCMKFNLSAVAEYLEIGFDKRHRALDDSLLAYRIFEKLKEI